MKQALALSGGKDSLACLHLLKDELACAIYVDTGYSYPETQAVIDYTETLLPVYRVKSDRDGQQARTGWPADVVPIEWTDIGQRMTKPKPVKIQSYLQCCFENIAIPCAMKAKELGCTHLVSGQRADEPCRATSLDGETVNGLIRRYPILEWTAPQVLAYLGERMAIPEHFFITHSSLDCYDCTAFTAHSQDRVAWTKQRHPEKFAAYAIKQNAIYDAIMEAITC